MRRLILTAIAGVLCIGARAVSPAANDSTPDIVTTLTRGGNITIEQPQQLLRRLQYDPTPAVDESAAADERATATRTGFRVEVFADNNVRTAKARAAAKRTQLMSRLPQYRVYVTFEAPFWRVRLGDFATKAAADAAMAQVRQALPSAGADLRVVRCQINKP